MSQARRLRKPVALIVLDVDDRYPDD